MVVCVVRCRSWKLKENGSDRPFGLVERWGFAQPDRHIIAPAPIGA